MFRRNAGYQSYLLQKRKEYRLEQEIRTLNSLKECVMKHGSSPAIVDFLNKSGVTEIKNLNISTEFLMDLLMSVTDKIEKSKKEKDNKAKAELNKIKLIPINSNSIKQWKNFISNYKSKFKLQSDYTSRIEKVSYMIENADDSELANFYKLIKSYEYEYEHGLNLVTKGHIESLCVITHKDNIKILTDAIKQIDSIDKDSIRNINDVISLTKTIVDDFYSISSDKKFRIFNFHLIKDIRNGSSELEYSDVSDIYSDDRYKFREEYLTRSKHLQILDMVKTNINEISAFSTNIILNDAIVFAEEEFADNKHRYNKDMLNTLLNVQTRLMNRLSDIFEFVLRDYFHMYESLDIEGDYYVNDEI